MGKNDGIRLPWQLDMLYELDAEKAAHFQVGEGVKVALEGRVEAPSHLYLVQVDDATKGVTILHPAEGDPPLTPTSARARVPEAGFAVTRARGRVVLVAGPRPLTLAEIAELAGGREPAPGGGTITKR